MFQLTVGVPSLVFAVLLAAKHSWHWINCSGWSWRAEGWASASTVLQEQFAFPRSCFCLVVFCWRQRRAETPDIRNLHLFVSGIEAVARPQELFPAARQTGQPSSWDLEAVVPTFWCTFLMNCVKGRGKGKPSLSLSQVLYGAPRSWDECVLLVWCFCFRWAGVLLNCFLTQVLELLPCVDAGFVTVKNPALY